MMIFHWALRELWNGRKFSLFYILNFSLGLIGLVVLSSFQNSLKENLQGKSKEILSADFSIHARRILSDTEVAAITSRFKTPFETSRKIHLYTMAAHGERTQLVHLKGIEPNFPLYGRITFRDKTVLSPSLMKELQEKNGLWIYSELADQLQLKEGDHLVLDGRRFNILKIVEDDSTDIGVGFSLAPRAYIPLGGLLGTPLVSQKSNLFDYRFFKFQIPPPLEKLREDLERDIRDNSIQINDPQKAAIRAHSVFERFGDYLGLMGLVATFLSAIGSIYLIQNYLEKKKKNAAIYKALGLSPFKVKALYLWELTLLGLISTILCLTVTWFSLPALESFVRPFLNFEYALKIPPVTLLSAFLLGGLGGFFIGLPSLLKLDAIRPHHLLKGDFSSTPPAAPSPWGYLPGVVFFWFLAVFISRSFFTGTLFLGALALAYGGFFLLGWTTAFILQRLKIRSFLLNLTLKNIYRKKWALTSTLVALGLSLSLLNLIPVLESILREEITQPEDSIIPGLFLFDIQEEQVTEIDTFLSGEKLKLENVSPLVTARILKVNGLPFERLLKGQQFKTREEERQSWARNRGYNLTYDFRPGGGDQDITEGKPFTDQSSPMEVSLEFRFAERLNLKVGDEILFDIQGLEVPSRVMNLRKVRWTTFRPNFFIKVRKKDLQEAPKSFLAVIKPMEGKKRGHIQRLLGHQFPNIAIIDVNRSVEKILDLVVKLGGLLKGMSLLGLLVGLLIISTIANFEANRQLREMNLLKVLGMTLGELRLMTALHFGFLSLLSAIWGILFCLGLSYVFSQQLFEGASPAIPWKMIFLSCALVVFLSCLVATLSIWKVFRTPSRELLSST